ncbi:response regulator transcription factor [Flavobacterium tegetincola]|uniref:response regulator transcription factor n=1 Tax=Flavobacterium tegetincola TaxID=150172 RepID=UPI00047E4038|nr:response regulator transcription factor [Flavobacterium tegetincola]
MNILIADDHSSTVTGLQTILKQIVNNEFLTFSESFSCEETFQRIHDTLSKNKVFDLALLDYGMPPCPEQEIYSGGDLALHLKSVMSEFKVLLMTGAMNGITVFDVVQKY